VVAAAEGGEAKSVRPYLLGFIFSIALTLLAFWVVWQGLFNTWAALLTLMGLAVMQLVVQLVFFLQLGRRSNRQWNILVSLLAVTVIFIVGGGSLWIMFNLTARMMPPM
jgi:cytochrome o ubiquinol oxidase subunit IV